MGSNLRPELREGNIYMQAPLSRAEALRRIYKSVARRRSLTRGKLHDGEQHCALGCADADCKKNRSGFSISQELADEIAAINDKLGLRVSPKLRWQYVVNWLRKEMTKLSSAADRGVAK